MPSTLCSNKTDWQGSIWHRLVRLPCEPNKPQTTTWQHETASAVLQSFYNRNKYCAHAVLDAVSFTSLRPRTGLACAASFCCSSARNLLANEKIAIKKISNAFENSVDAKRTLRYRGPSNARQPARPHCYGSPFSVVSHSTCQLLQDQPCLPKLPAVHMCRP